MNTLGDPQAVNQARKAGVSLSRTGSDRHGPRRGFCRGRAVGPFYHGLIFALADPEDAVRVCEQIEADQQTTMNTQDLQDLQQRIRARAEQDCAAIDRIILLNEHLEPGPTLPALTTPRNHAPRPNLPRRRGAQTARPASAPAGSSNGSSKRGKRSQALRAMILAQPGEFSDRELLAQVPALMPAYRDETDLHWLQTALFREKKLGMIEQLRSDRQHGTFYRRVKSKEEAWAALRASFTTPTVAD